MQRRRTLAVVGAGAAGLIAAKVLLDDGFDVTLFERDLDLGGTWSDKMAYLELHTQQPGGTMEFSDLYEGTGKDVKGRHRHLHPLFQSLHPGKRRMPI